MASICKKKIKGHIYYYARECRKVNGKPKIVWQKYLGKAVDIIDAVQGTGHLQRPKEVELFEFGASTALFWMATKTGIIEIIERVVPKRIQGPTLGQYMVVAAINRAVCPRSKNRIGDWYEKTSLRRLVPMDRSALSSKRFWDNMGLLKANSIRVIEKELAQRLAEKFALDLRALVYDTSNFITFINTFNDRVLLAQRGRSKQKRSDLRIVGLALLVSTDFHVPLFHEVYPGNRHDSVEFESVVEELAARYAVLSRTCENITLVFDKGNNSQDNIESLDQSRYHFIGSLVPTQHQDLLQVSKRMYRSLSDERLEGVLAYRTKKVVHGRERTVVVTFNPELYLTQLETLTRQIRKRTAQLAKLKGRIRRKQRASHRGRCSTRKSVEKELKLILSARHIKDVIHVDLTEKQGVLQLRYRVDTGAISRLSRRLFGKKILFTDNSSWTTEEIILGYRGLYHVEGAIRQMKNPHFVSWRPMFHWTDQKIRVHAFYCVLALALTSLLKRHLYQNGISISTPQMIEKLSDIKEVAIIYPRRRRTLPSPVITLSKMDELQERMFDTVGLSQFAPS